MRARVRNHSEPIADKPEATEEFLEGVKTLFKGFQWFFKQPKSMLFGILPAVITSGIIITVLTVLIIYINPIVGLLTGFTSGWVNAGAVAMKVAIGAVIITGAVYASILSFVALTLAIGDPFYNKIWKEVELHESGEIPDKEPSFFEGLKDSLAMIFKALLVAIVAASLSLIPVVGPVLSAAAGFLMTSYLLSNELTARAMNARGINGKQRSTFVKKNFARSLGFGFATQLCMLIPFGALFTMPAAIVGSTRLAKHVGNL
jgi:CysZ protein